MADKHKSYLKILLNPFSFKFDNLKIHNLAEQHDLAFKIKIFGTVPENGTAALCRGISHVSERERVVLIMASTILYDFQICCLIFLRKKPFQPKVYQAA